MGQSGDVYQRYYTPTNTGHDIQAIYFGTPSEKELIQSVASMGLSRDKRAPKELNDTQRNELRNDPSLVALRKECDAYKRQLKEEGHYPLSLAKGESLHNEYEQTRKKIANKTQQLSRLRLKEEIRKFHNSIDTIEIANQLGGKEAIEVVMLPAVEFELPERATIAAMLFTPFQIEQTRMKFVHVLAQLFRMRETRRSKVTKRAAPKRALQSCASAKLTKIVHSPKKCKTNHDGKLTKQGPDRFQYKDVLELQSRHTYPNVPNKAVCGFCYGNEQLSYEGRTRHWERKDVRSKHIQTHLRDDRYQGEFVCPYPDCSSTLEGATHFLRHSIDAHKVAH
jgi:hypothetical protein